MLASHGMRSRVTGEDGPSAPVVSLPVADLPIPPRPVMPPPIPVVDEGPPEPAAPRPADPSGSVPALASLTVEESVDGVTVVATAADGRRFSQRTAATEEAVAAAVVAVVGALAEGKPPRLLAVTLGATEGTEVVTVLLERVDMTRTAGAAVVKAGRAYAVARATWAALRVAILQTRVGAPAPTLLRAILQTRPGQPDYGPRPPPSMGPLPHVGRGVPQTRVGAPTPALLRAWGPLPHAGRHS